MRTAVRRWNWRHRTALVVAAMLAVALTHVPQSAQAAPAAPSIPAPAPECPTARPDAASASVTARLCGKAIEVTDATTENDQTFANADGTFQWRHSYHVARVRRGDAWVPVDPKLRFDVDGTVVPTATKVEVRFSGGGSGPLVVLTVGDQKLEIDSPLGPLPKPTLAGATATYPEVLKGVDLQVIASGEGYSQVLVVKDSEAARHPQLSKLEFATRTAGLSFSSDKHGNVTLLDRAGKTALTASRPRLWDDAAGRSNVAAKASGKARTKAMPLQVNKNSVTVLPDVDVLGDPDTAYPVRIDPSMSLYLTAWAIVFSDDPWAVYYNPDWDAQSGTWNGGGQVARTFFQMSPDQSWLGKQITSATFSITETWSYSCNARPVELWWTGAINGSTSWNTQPEWIEYQDAVSAAKGYNGNCPAGGLGFNITSLTQRAAGGNWPNMTVGLISPQEWDSLGWKRYDPYSASISVTYNGLPYINNQTTSPAMLCTTGIGRPLTNTKTPTLHANVVDPDGGQVKAKFELRSVGGSSNIFATETGMGPSGSVFSATVPANLLADGGNYSWRVIGSDGSIYSGDGLRADTWSSWCEFTVDTNKPGAPFVSSALYPPITTNNDWGHGGSGQAGQFTFRASSAPANAIGSWPMSEGSGATAADASGNNHPVTLHQETGWATAPSGSALALSGPRSTLLATGAGSTRTSLAGRGGRCLDIHGASVENGAAIELYDCHGGWNQVFEPQSNGAWKNPYSGKCLDLTAYGTGNGTVLQLYECTGAWNQVFQRQWDGSLKNPQSGRCLDDANFNTANGAPILLWDCLGGAWNQHWQPQANGSLVSTRSDQCIDVYNAGTADGTKIEGWNCNGGPAQRWAYQANRGIKNPNSGKCIDVQSSGTANGTIVWLYTCNGTGAQIWDPQPDGSLRNPNSGKCLDAGVNAWNGQQLVINDCVSGAVSQKWVDSVFDPYASSFPGLNTTQSFSVSAWARLSTVTGNWPTVVSADANRTSPFGLGLDDSLRWSFWTHTSDSDTSGNVRSTSPSPVVANSWVQLVGVYDQPAATIRLYVNGVLAASTSNVPPIFANTGRLTIGRHQWTNVQVGLFPGSVDDVRVYGRALSAAEIAGIDTVGYRYQLDGATSPTDIAATGDATVTIIPPEDGRRTLTVWTKDRANNLSNPTTYVFNVGRAGSTSPAAGAVSVKRMKLSLSTDPALTRATFQYRRGPGGAEYDVPLANLHKQDGSAVSAYPVTLSTLGSYGIWDAVDTLGSTGGAVQVRAKLFTATGSTPDYTTQWVSVTVDPNGDTGASAQVGPGSLNLLTGDYTLTSTDVDEFGLSVERVASSRVPTDGWLPQGQRLTANQQQVAANQPVQGTGFLQGNGWAAVSQQMMTDFDGDGKTDILGLNGTDLLLWRSTSTASTMSFAPTVSLGSGWNALSNRLTGDFDGDGRPDIGGFATGGAELWIHRNTSTAGNPSKAGGVFVSNGWATVSDQRAVDFDGDGKADIVGRAGDNLMVWRSTSTSSAFSFAPVVDLGTGWNSYPTLLPPGDLDGDGKADLAAFNAAGDQLWAFRNTSTLGNSSLAAGVQVTGTWSAITKSTVTVSDYDGDGRVDLLGRDAGNNLLLLRSKSTAFNYSFQPSFTLGAGFGGYGRFYTADWDGDNRPDASAYTASNAELWIYRNIGSADGFVGGTATINKTANFGQGSSKTALEIVPLRTDGDTYAAVDGDNGGMRLGMQAGKRYRMTGWIYVPAASGLTPTHSRGLRVLGFYKDATGYHEVSSPKAAWVDGWQELKVDLAVPAGATEAFFRLYNGFSLESGKKVYWDNLSVTELVAPFGPQWRGGTGGGPADADYTSLELTSTDLAKITTVDGTALTFARNPGTGQFFPQPGAEDLTLTKTGDTTYLLSDLDGTKVQFALQGNAYLVTATWTADGPETSTTRYVYDTTDKRALVKRVIAAVEPGIGDCTTATPAVGCEVLEYDYATTTTATSTALGDFTDHVRAVKLWSYDPLQGESAVEVMRYAYDDQGRLRQVWDPRLPVPVMTEYSYDSDRVISSKPAGEFPWMFDYGSIAAEPGNTGRLHRVRRQALQQGSPTVPDGEIASRIVYQVPLTRGDGGPNDMNAAAISTWGQSDLPTDATAIFGPEDDPAVVQATSSTPGNNGFTRATVHYLNASAQEVNTAAPHPAGVPGASIDSAQFDRFGNTVWTLEATNRLLALGQLPNAASMLSELGLSTLDTAQRAQALASINKYSPDGLDHLESTGPTLRLILESDLPDPDGSGPLPAITRGSTVAGRSHTVNVYDEGKPDGADYHLVTTSTKGLSVAGYPDADSRITKTGYDPHSGGTSGWTLKKPTTLISDAGAGGINAISRVVYDTAGRTVASWGIDSDGADARTTKVIYYTAGANTLDTACGNKPQWAGQPCLTRKAGPVTRHDAARMATNLPERRVLSYNRWADVKEVSETVPGTTTSRTTSTQYDNAGRVTGVQITSVDDGAVPLSGITTDYSPETGHVTQTHTDVGTVTREYDRLGRLYRYTDADGGVTINEFDRYGKPAKVSDPTGWATFTYNRTAEPRGLLTSVTDSVAGTFTAEYSPDGQLTTLHYPNGMTRVDTLNANLEPVSRQYKRDSDGAVVYSESIVDNSAGEIVAHTFTGGSRTYTYDRLGRLTGATDTAVTAGCTTRTYGYDTRTNRLSRKTFNPDAGGLCRSTGTVDAQDNHAYDTADRITDTGYTYDAFGRITTLPSGLTNTYHANDLIASQAFGTSRQNWTLDPNHRLRGFTTETLVDGAWVNATSKLNHYGDDSDEPRWIIEDTTLGSLTRMVSGPDANLVATTSATGNVAYQITNLHGDVVTTVDTSLVPTAFLRFDEFGVAATGQAETRYGWLGGQQRSAEALGDVVLMGVRLYHPDSGRFLQTDPVDGGSATAYDYCNADPINCTDIDGKWPSWSGIKKALNVVAQVAEVASMIPGPIGTIAGVVSAGAYAATGNWQAAAWAAAGAAAAMVGAGAAVKVAKVAVNASKVAKAAAPAQKALRAGASCAVNSFTPNTPVLMADGSRLPISVIQAGDYVAAADPATGELRAQPVLDVIVGQGTKHLVRLDLDGDASDTLTVTAAHPIWIVGQGWTNAVDVRPGDTLLGQDGATAHVRTIQDLGEIAGQTVVNLNVGNTHTYLVGADGEDVLVHNCSFLAKVTRFVNKSKFIPRQIKNAYNNYFTKAPMYSRNPAAPGNRITQWVESPITGWVAGRVATWWNRVSRLAKQREDRLQRIQRGRMERGGRGFRR